MTFSTGQAQAVITPPLGHSLAGYYHDRKADDVRVVKANRILEVHRRASGTLPAEISAIAIGETALVGLPGEIFVELGLEIKARSPFPYTFVIELCNGEFGYVPTRQACNEGGYEASSSPFVPGTGEQMVEAALALLEELARETRGGLWLGNG